MHVRSSEVPLFHPTPSFSACSLLSVSLWVGVSLSGSGFFRVAHETPTPQQGPPGSICQRRHSLRMCQVKDKLVFAHPIGYGSRTILPQEGYRWHTQPLH